MRWRAASNSANPPLRGIDGEEPCGRGHQASGVETDTAISLMLGDAGRCRAVPSAPPRANAP